MILPTTEPDATTRSMRPEHGRRRVWIAFMWLLWSAASSSCSGDAPGRSRFVVVGPAVVRDERTALEWTRRDDGVGLDWYAADAYCRSLSIDDKARWRLPGIEELRGLYDERTRTSCGRATCAIDPTFALTSPYVWSATEQGGIARTYLDFQFGTELSPTITPRLVRSVLCVRTA